MAGDNIKINPLERALSEDINNLQAMQARRRAEMWGLLSSQRGIASSGLSIDTFAKPSTMGLDARPSADPTEILIGAGVLQQFSPTWPSAPGPLESAVRLGILREIKAVSLSGVPNAFDLVEARVVDVVTVSEMRDRFDVPTQTFIPTNFEKQIERQIEFQVVTDSGTVPIFSGDPWVPLYIFMLDGAGEITSMPTPLQWDCRPDLKDIVGDDQIREVASFEAGDAKVTSWALHSQDEGALQTRICGNFHGRIGDQKAWFRADDGFVPSPDNLVTGVGNTLEHFFLCPLKANGVSLFPVTMGSALESTTRGVLMRSGVPGGVAGPDNSGVLTWDPVGPYANFNPVGSHRAVYCGSAYVGQSGLPSDGYVPFSQSSGGRCYIRAVRTGTPPATVKVGFRISGALAAPEDVDVFLAGIVPNGARTAMLQVALYSTGGTGFTQYNFQRLGKTDAWGPFGQLTAGIGPADVHSVEVPVHESTLDGPLAAMSWQLHLQPSGGTPTLSVEIDLMGWSF